MWCPGWDCSSWALLLSMGGGASGGVRVFCAPRTCGVGEPWNRLSYLLVLCLRGLDFACITFVYLFVIYTQRGCLNLRSSLQFRLSTHRLPFYGLLQGALRGHRFADEDDETKHSLH